MIDILEEKTKFDTKTESINIFSGLFLSIFFIFITIHNVNALSDIGIINLPSHPTDMVFNIYDLKIYVAHSNSISIIDGITNQLIKTENLNFNIDSITAGVGGIYIAGGTATDKNLYLYNGHQVTLKTPLPASAANSIAYNPIHKEIYVNLETLNKVIIIDIVNWQIIAEIPINEDAKKIIFNPYDNKMYLIHNNLNAKTVSVIDTQTKQVKSIYIGYRSNDIALNTFNRNIYVFSEDSRILYIIDIYKGEVVGNVFLGISEEPNLVFNPVDNKMYLFGIYFVSVIDSTTNTVSNIIPEKFNLEFHPIINPINNKMYIANDEPNYRIIFKQFNTNPSNAICPNENIQNLTKIIFRIVDAQIASSLSLPVNSELDITLLDPHINKVTDIKKTVGDYLGIANPRNSIEITDIEYSRTCSNA